MLKREVLREKSNLREGDEQRAHRANDLSASSTQPGVREKSKLASVNEKEE